jgi:hypothetical protein
MVQMVQQEQNRKQEQQQERCLGAKQLQALGVTTFEPRSLPSTELSRAHIAEKEARTLLVSVRALQDSQALSAHREMGLHRQVEGLQSEVQIHASEKKDLVSTAQAQKHQLQDLQRKLTVARSELRVARGELNVAHAGGKWVSAIEQLLSLEAVDFSELELSLFWFRVGHVWVCACVSSSDSPYGCLILYDTGGCPRGKSAEKTAGG